MIKRRYDDILKYLDIYNEHINLILKNEQKDGKNKLGRKNISSEDMRGIDFEYN